jgi:hypothetical protein
MHDAGTRQQWVYDRDYLYFDENVFRIKKWKPTLWMGEQMIDRFQMNKSIAPALEAGFGRRAMQVPATGTSLRRSFW